MSDLWFLVTVYLFFYFLYTTEFSKPSKIFLTGISLILASITRVNGFILIGSWWIYLWSNEEDKKSKIKDLFVSLPFVLIVLYFKKLDSQYESNHFDLLSTINISTILDNLFLYCNQIGQFVLYHLGFLPLTGKLFGIVLFFYFGYALKSIERLKLFAPILIWVLTNFVLIVVWPIPQGTRYLLPIIPFIIWIAVVGFNDWIQNQKINKVISFSFIVLLLIQSLASIGFYRFAINTNKVIGVSQADIYQHIENLVADDDIIAFDKPRWLHLVTNKKCIRKLSDSTFFNSAAKYWLITNKNIYHGRNNKLTNPKLDSIYGNAEFTLYRRNDFLQAK
jgi:hypothetical protein